MKRLALLATLLVACGPGPKPAELVQFENARLENAETIKDRFPKLYAEAEAQYRRAIEAHEDNEPEDALHYTRLAATTWRTSVAKSQHQDHENSLKAAQNRQKIAQEQVNAAKARIAAAKDAIERQKRLIEMQRRLAETEAKASADRKTAAAKAKVDAAALKLKEAESIEAATYAPGEFNKANASLQMALDAFSKGDYRGAETAASAALTDATAAVVAATPHWEKEQKRRAIDTRLKALLQASAQIPGAEARLETRGLVVTLRGLFAPGKVQIAPERTFAVDQAAKLAGDYSEFRMVVEGHTDNRGRASKNLSLSEDRARAVAGYLGSKGIDAGRMTAIGKGDSEPVADNSSKDGREQNRRVDLVFLRPPVN